MVITQLRFLLLSIPFGSFLELVELVGMQCMRMLQCLLVFERIVQLGLQWIL